jgi:hypothetical protein
MIKLRARFGAIVPERLPPDGPPFNAAHGVSVPRQKPRHLFTKTWMAASGLSVAIIGKGES